MQSACNIPPPTCGLNEPDGSNSLRLATCPLERGQDVRAPMNMMRRVRHPRFVVVHPPVLEGAWGGCPNDPFTLRTVVWQSNPAVIGNDPITAMSNQIDRRTFEIPMTTPTQQPRKSRKAMRIYAHHRLSVCPAHPANPCLAIQLGGYRQPPNHGDQQRDRQASLRGLDDLANAALTHMSAFL